MESAVKIRDVGSVIDQIESSIQQLSASEMHVFEGRMFAHEVRDFLPGLIAHLDRYNGDVTRLLQSPLETVAAFEPLPVLIENQRERIRDLYTLLESLERE